MLKILGMMILIGAGCATLQPYPTKEKDICKDVYEQVASTYAEVLVEAHPGCEISQEMTYCDVFDGKFNRNGIMVVQGEAIGEEASAISGMVFGFALQNDKWEPTHIIPLYYGLKSKDGTDIPAEMEEGLNL